MEKLWVRDVYGKIKRTSEICDRLSLKVRGTPSEFAESIRENSMATVSDLLKYSFKLAKSKSGN